LASIRDACCSAVSLSPGFVRDIVVEQVGTDVTNKTAAVNLAVATQLSDRILDEVTHLLKVTCDQLVSANWLWFQFFFCYFFVTVPCAKNRVEKIVQKNKDIWRMKKNRITYLHRLSSGADGGKKRRETN